MPRHDIHHIDGDRKNNEPHNLLLMCHKCNQAAEETRGQEGPPTAQPGNPPRNRHENQIQNDGQGVAGRGVPMWEREQKSATEIARGVLNYRTGSLEAQANDFYEVEYRNWILRQVHLQGFVEKGDALASGAETVGCSINTTRRYLMKLTSSMGKLEESRDALGQTIITAKAVVEETRLITLAQASRRYSIPETTIRRWRDAGQIGRWNGKLVEGDIASLAAKREGNE